MKDTIRNKILNQRKEMSVEEVNKKSVLIQERLYATQHYDSARTIMTYVDIQNEVETRSIISRALQEGKNIVVPVCGPDYSLLPIKIDSFDELESGTMGILEPRKRKSIVEARKLDLILVPGIAFDREGNRLGYGLSYYDRFMENLSPSTVTIALAYEFQVVPQVPVEGHDQKVNMIITENEIIKCI